MERLISHQKRVVKVHFCLNKVGQVDTREGARQQKQLSCPDSELRSQSGLGSLENQPWTHRRGTDAQGALKRKPRREKGHSSRRLPCSSDRSTPPHIEDGASHTYQENPPGHTC